MRAILAAAVVVAFAAPALARVHFGGGDGSTAASAIVILGAVGEDAGIAAEHAWLKAHRPGARVLRQRLVMRGIRQYDILTLGGAASGDVWFDISGFFGK
jgi:hypothetical protein